MPDRRQVTALSYDLVGSTRLSERLDPEEMQELVHSFHRACTMAIHRFDGGVEKYTGDGAMAYFGLPSAHEDDALRAVEAGLGIIEECAKLNRKVGRGDIQVTVRVGIATGLVVAGNFGSDQLFGLSDVVGVAPNLAFKIQAAGAPNTVLISSTTRKLIGRNADCRQRAELPLGLATPQKTWQVMRIRRHVTRFWAARKPLRTPLISRAGELDAILDSWRAAEQYGRGKAVLISGEAGIGKSRLAATAQEILSREGARVMVFQCSEQHCNTALHPVISQLERALRKSRTDTPAAVRRRLNQFIERNCTDWQVVAPWLAHLLPFLADDGFPPREFTPEKIKERTLAALLHLVDDLAAVRPMFLMVEDAHWIDPTSDELLDLLVREICPHRRMLVLVTGRPDYQPRWKEQFQATTLFLERLNRQNSRTMVEYLLASRVLSPGLIGRIIDAAEGVPLYIEELTAATLDLYTRESPGGESQDRQPPVGASEPENWVEMGQPPFDLPATLSDQLMARLDQLGKFREIAQIGSAIGRTFLLDLVRQVADAVSCEVDLGISRLVETGLASLSLQVDGPVCSFKHALIQEAAYQSMLRSQRREIHRRIAGILSSAFMCTPYATPEVLAHHYAEAGMVLDAIRSLQEAGRDAAARSANVEACRLFRRALHLTESLPEGEDRVTLELDLTISLGPVLMSTLGPGAAETRALYERGVELCLQLPQTAEHFAAYWGWWRTSPTFKEMHGRATILSRLATTLNDRQLELQAHHCQWATLFMLGHQEACFSHIEAGIRIYDQGDYHLHGTLYGGHDPKVCACGERALSMWLLGRPEEALRSIAEGAALADRLQHVGSIGHSRDQEIMLHRYRGDARAVLAKAEAMAVFAAEQASGDLASKSQLFKGWALAALGDPASGVRLIEEGLAVQQRIGTQEDFPVYFDMLAEALDWLDRPEEALARVDEAIAMAERTGLRYWSAELFRRRGDLLIRYRPGDPEEAMTNLNCAIDIARAQGASALHLRAAMSKARLETRYATTGPGTAHDQLQAIRDSFSEGLGTPDLIEAERMLRKREC
jgi:class 3 adenylate cyclase/predicted ATPase